MDNAETTEGKDVAIATEFTWFDGLPNDEKSMEIKETVNIDHDNMKFKQRHEEPLITELEIWFNIDDLRIGIDKVKDDIYNVDALTKIVFRIAILPQGKGLQSLFQLEQELQPECEANELAPDNLSRDFCNSNSNKELSGTITLVVGKREDGALNVLNAYLNGI